MLALFRICIIRAYTASRATHEANPPRPKCDMTDGTNYHKGQLFRSDLRRKHGEINRETKGNLNIMLKRAFNLPGFIALVHKL